MSNEASATPIEGPSAGSSPSSGRAALVVLTLAAGFALIPRATKGCGAAALDEDAPGFKARVVANGENVPTTEASAPTALDLGSLKGHAVVLDFWATWCGPCQAEAPIVNTIAQRYKDRG